MRFDLASIVSCSLFNLLKMKKTLLFSYGLLILLTVVTALISNFVSTASLVVGLVMGLSMLKFILVSFEFMELKKANSFWKISVISVLLLIIVPLILLRIV